MLTTFLVILALIILNGAFALAEIAIVSARNTRLQQLVDEGHRSARMALELSLNPNRVLSTVQVGITLVGVLSGAVAGISLSEPLGLILGRIPALQPYSQQVALVFVVVMTTYLSLVVGELIPKRLGLSNPEKIALFVAEPMHFLSVIASPIVSLLSASTNLGLRMLGASSLSKSPITTEEIKIIIDQGARVGVLEKAEQAMLESVFRLGERRVDAIMTPRTEIIWLDLEDTYETNLRKVVESHHTHFPVSRGSLDDVEGILVAHDLLVVDTSCNTRNIQDLLRPPLFIPESKPALNTLEVLKSSDTHVALVMDEYGGLLGMVTLFDILKSIVGDIPVSGDKSDLMVTRRPDGSWLMDGLLRVDELKDMLEIKELPDEDRVRFQTLGGFIMNYLGAIPCEGESFEWNDLRFEVVDMDGKRVDKVLVTPLQRADPKNLSSPGDMSE